MRLAPGRGASTSLRHGIAAITLGILLAACGGSDAGVTGPRIEEPPSNNSSTAQTGRLMVWTSDAAPSPIAVVVDGQAVGTLTSYWTSAPSCGDHSAGSAITLTLPTGVHTVAAHETQSNGNWPAASVNIMAGQCVPYHLMP